MFYQSLLLTWKNFVDSGNVIGWHGEIGRPETEAILSGLPVGTFLTRYSTHAKSYIISHVLPDKTIQHIANITKEQQDRVKVVMKQGIFFYNTFAQFVYDCMHNPVLHIAHPLPSTHKFDDHIKDNPLRRNLRNSSDFNEDSTTIQLMQCGFEEKQVRQALRESGNDFDKTLGLLHIQGTFEKKKNKLHWQGREFALTFFSF